MKKVCLIEIKKLNVNYIKKTLEGYQLSRTLIFPNFLIPQTTIKLTNCCTPLIYLYRAGSLNTLFDIAFKNNPG